MTNTTNAPGFSTALLAGGWSTRMGCDKAFLPWAGNPLWIHQLEKLRALEPQALLLSCRAEQGFTLPPDVMPVYDRILDCGPLGGVAACLNACRTPLLLVLGVDLPLLPPAFLRSLLMKCSGDCGAVISLCAEGRDRFEPLAAVYPSSLLGLAEEHLESGVLSMQAFIRRGIALGRMTVASMPVEAAWFRNVNTPGDAAHL